MIIFLGWYYGFCIIRFSNVLVIFIFMIVSMVTMLSKVGLPSEPILILMHLQYWVSLRAQNWDQWGLRLEASKARDVHFGCLHLAARHPLPLGVLYTHHLLKHETFLSRAIFFKVTINVRLCMIVSLVLSEEFVTAGTDPVGAETGSCWVLLGDPLRWVIFESRLSSYFWLPLRLLSCPVARMIVHVPLTYIIDTFVCHHWF